MSTSRTRSCASRWSSALDLVVHIARGADGARRVVAVDEVGEVGRDARLGVRPLATAAGVVALPLRPPRSPEAGPPCAEWLET